MTENQDKARVVTGNLASLPAHLWGWGSIDCDFLQSQYPEPEICDQTRHIHAQKQTVDTCGRSDAPPFPASPLLRKFNFHPVPNAHEQDNPGTKSALPVLKSIAGLPHGRL